MATNSWKQLEREVASHFDVKRNIKRGSDFGIEDTDVDVFERDEWRGVNFIIDCKYRTDKQIVVSDALRDWDKKCPGKDLNPMLIVHSPEATYAACLMRDFTPEMLEDEGSWEDLWVTTMVMRKNANYLDEWFEKLDTTYKPLKAEEFMVDDDSIVPLVALRAKGGPVVIIWDINKGKGIDE